MNFCSYDRNHDIVKNTPEGFKTRNLTQNFNIKTVWSKHLIKKMLLFVDATVLFSYAFILKTHGGILYFEQYSGLKYIIECMSIKLFKDANNRSWGGGGVWVILLKI